MDEEKHKKGKKELETLSMMFERWLKSDFNWALRVVQKEGRTWEEDEWDFLRRDWIDKLESWVGPFVRRLHDTGYITSDELSEFGRNAAENIKIMLEALDKLGVKENNE